MSECPTCGRGDFKREQDMKVHHTKVHNIRLAERETCQICEASFVPNQGSEGKFCSPECSQEAQREREPRSCEKCTRTFWIQPNRSDVYCSRSCWLETHHDRPRPDDPEALLWLLYLYEGFSIDETFRRQRAVLGFENRLYKDDVRQKLRDMGVTRRYASWSLQKADPDTVGGAKPEGSDEWKRHYSSA